MRRNRINTIAFLLCLTTGMWAQQREVVNLNYDWDFSRDSLFNDSRKVDVPHDFQIEQPWVARTSRQH